jgi:hypothetical protein
VRKKKKNFEIFRDTKNCGIIAFQNKNVKAKNTRTIFLVPLFFYWLNDENLIFLLNMDWIFFDFVTTQNKFIAEENGMKKRRKEKKKKKKKKVNTPLL